MCTPGARCRTSGSEPGPERAKSSTPLTNTTAAGRESGCARRVALVATAWTSISARWK